MFSRTLKAHKLKINTQMRQQASRQLRVAELQGVRGGLRRLSGPGGFQRLRQTWPWPWLPHHSYAMKTFIWQKPFSATAVVVVAVAQWLLFGASKGSWPRQGWDEGGFRV